MRLLLLAQLGCHEGYKGERIQKRLETFKKQYIRIADTPKLHIFLFKIQSNNHDSINIFSWEMEMFRRIDKLEERLISEKVITSTLRSTESIDTMQAHENQSNSESESDNDRQLAFVKSVQNCFPQNTASKVYHVADITSHNETRKLWGDGPSNLNVCLLRYKRSVVTYVNVHVHMAAY
jgi:hypothetical protein